MLVLDRALSSLSSRLFKGLPRRLRPSGRQISIIFGNLLVFSFVTCRSQSDLYLRRFSSTGSAFKSSNILPFSLWSKRVHPSVFRKYLIANDVKRFVSFFFKGSNFASYKRMGTASELYTFFFKISGPKIVSKCCL